MDTPTQALLGAAVGQAVFGRRLGPRAAWLGALGGALPDIDVLTGLMADPMSSWLYHRGITHSLFFAPLAGLTLGLIVHWLEKRRPEKPLGQGELERGSPQRRLALVGLFTLTVLSHPLLDLFTVYGTQLLAPFTNARYALNAVAVVDPAYSLILIAALLVGVVWRRKPKIPAAAAAIALLLSSGYLLWGLSINARAETLVARQLEQRGENDAEVRSYPTLFQLFLRRVVVRGEDEVRVGYFSAWSWNTDDIDWSRHDIPRDPRIDQLLASREGSIFNWFSMNQHLPRIVEDDEGATIELADIRYGVPQASEPGLWGLSARFDGRGRMTSSPAPFRRRVDWEANGFDEIFRAVFSGPESSDRRSRQDERAALNDSMRDEPEELLERRRYAIDRLRL